jgi:hypothetical protein
MVENPHQQIGNALPISIDIHIQKSKIFSLSRPRPLTALKQQQKKYQKTKAQFSFLPPHLLS